LHWQQETIFSDGKSFAITNPWDCFEVGVKNLFYKLNLKLCRETYIELIFI